MPQKSPIKATGYITQFDSSTSMFYALGNALKKQAFKGVQVIPDKLEFITSVLNWLPFGFRQKIYRWSGGWTALDPAKLKTIRAEEISTWVVGQYPRRRYPAVMIGSSNGALIHLAAALGVPWLPQTFLVAVRRRLDPDEIEADIEWGRRAAGVIRAKNPELKINQMHDPVQDRLMIAKMAYFRIKRAWLGAAYERFIRETLIPGGTLIVLDTRLPWPMISVGEEHTFQVGGLGALDPYEYLEGSARVRSFLRSEGSSRKRWPLPGRVFEAPESEWGFHPPLGEDILRFAKKHSFRIKRVVFDEPEAPSFFIADLYRWWFRKNNQPANRLLVECFALIEPWLSLETGLVPFWLAFNTEPSARALEIYLKGKRSFDEIYLMLMSNGLQGIGQVPIRRWKSLLGYARKNARFLGLNEKKYPMDFASFVRYEDDLKKIRVSPETVPTLTLAELDQFIAMSKKIYKIRWE